MKEETMTEKSVIKWFSELSINSKKIAGEKASYLAEAYNKKNFSKNVSIPAGFVITKDSIQSFFETGNIKNAIKNIFEETNKDNLEELKSASNKIKNLIMNTQFSDKFIEALTEGYENLSDDEIEVGHGAAYDILSNSVEPAFVAVRASYRNELGDSHFNIKGIPNIIYSTKKIIASLFEADLILKEINSGIKPEDICSAIIIQKMVQADKSGVVYSGDKIITKAIWGLGGALKLKEVGQDKYVAERSFRIIGKDIAEKKYAITRESSGALKLIGLKEGYSFMQVLEEHEVQELCNILLRIDDIFSERMQFEFAMLDGEISIIKINKVMDISETEPENLKPKENQESIDESVVIESIDSSSQAADKIEEKVVDDGAKNQDKEKKIEEKPMEEIITRTKIDALISNKQANDNFDFANIKSGVLTMENIIRERGIHPDQYIENFNTKGYGEVIYNGLKMNSSGLNEIWVRLSDFTVDEFKELEGAKNNSGINPMMGLNGVRYLLMNPELLKRELVAISKLKNENNSVGVLIPKISSVYELKKVKEIIDSLNIKLNIGIMLEIPASIQLIKDFIEDGIEAVVFRGDTLTEYLLAIDSNNSDTYKFYDDTNPALMYQLEYVIRVCNRKNIKTSFMGSATDKKEMIDYLIKKNINTLVITPKKIKSTVKLIFDAESEFISGTDKEMRQYEMNLEKERQKKELKEFEAAKNKEIEKKVIKDSALSEPVKKVQEVQKGASEKKPTDVNGTIVSDVDHAIELIEKEKQEELEKNKIKESIKMNDNKSNANKIPKSESLVIHPDNMNVESPANVDEAMKMIENHSNEEAELSDVERAMQEIDNHKTNQNKKEITEEVSGDELENIDEAISDVEPENVEEFMQKENNDLSNKDENMENMPEDISALNEDDNNLKNVDEKNISDSDKIKKDIELIESEKREYIENLKEDDTDFADGLDNEEQTSTAEEKDTLGIF